jgi:hypothetical protein
VPLSHVRWECGRRLHEPFIVGAEGLPPSASPSSEEKLLTDRRYNSGRRSKKYHKGGKNL